MKIWKSERTKRKLEKHSPKEIEEAVNKAFEVVNKGSVDTIDSLIREFIK